MNKTISGTMLVFGLLLSLICGFVIATTVNADAGPGQDWLMDLGTYGGIGGLLLGIGLFFFGSKSFAAK